jgi:integrase
VKPKGYRRTSTGFRAWVRVGRLPLATKRFPKGISEKAIRDWRADKRAELRATDRRRVHLAEVERPTPGTFRADAAIYLASVKGMPTYHHRAREIGAWVREFGDRQRAAITALEIRTVLARWVSDQGPNVFTRQLKHGGRRPVRFSPQSCNLYRAALSHLYTVLDGRSAANPVRDVPKLRTPDPEPRALAPGVGPEIFSHMAPSKTKARLLVIATTGIRHAQVMRIQPEADWNRHDRTLYVRSAKRSKPRAIPLTRDAIAALKMMDRYDGWGKFSQPSALRSFRRAIQATNRTRVKADKAAALIAPQTRAYDLRHTFGTAVMRETGNIHAVKELLTHSSAKLTERYLLAAVPAQLRAAVAKLPPLGMLPAKLPTKDKRRKHA